MQEQEFERAIEAIEEKAVTLICEGVTKVTGGAYDEGLRQVVWSAMLSALAAFDMTPSFEALVDSDHDRLERLFSLSDFPQTANKIIAAIIEDCRLPKASTEHGDRVLRAHVMAAVLGVAADFCALDVKLSMEELERQGLT